MLNKIMKAALAASLVFGMSSFAYAAEMKVGGAFQQYFGQYNKGTKSTATTDAYSSHFQAIGETNLQITGKAGKVSTFLELESATTTGNADADDWSEVKATVSYESPFALITIGNVVNAANVPKTSSGWKTSNIPNSTLKALYVSGYSEEEALDFKIPLEGMGLIQFTYYAAGGNAATYLGGADALGAGLNAGTWTPADAVSGKYKTESGYMQGTAMNLGAVLQFGQIGVSGVYATAKSDDPTSSNDEAVTTNNMGLGVKYTINDQMSVTFDYATAKLSWDTWTEDLKLDTMDLGFVMNVGPGALNVAYGTMTSTYGDKLYDLTVTSLLFDVPATKTSGFQVGYIANSKKPEGGGDTITETYMGGGIYAKF